MTKVIFILISFFQLFIFPSQVLAAGDISLQELQGMGFIKYEALNTNSLLFFAKRIGEKIINVDDQTLLNTRFNELVFIANFRKTNFLGEASSNYNAIAGRIIDGQNPLPEDKTRTYIKILEKMRDLYHSGSLPWIQLQQSLETTQRLI
ncbi:hypothetical protein A2617_02185 [Candidatus Daviesbacteria bacterium RIFOXYD1_FULL_41_10]|uniref:DUF5667 domain-containing protein n=1 Tax=Candidatus Daviesbacteria bacterium RIFOXYD1_FULL_41_10 TaxID=1797801 RepID=A0A1F5N0B2_9BACT|nr:MAG: hypothetical protein A2617_02185 [Candidatus Daviesbacteria bacterium RIFOXYD1_FULL_41_10]